MNEKSEKKPEPENKVAATSGGTPTATLGDVAEVVPLKQLEAEKGLHAITLNLLKKAEAELAAAKSVIVDRDEKIKTHDKILREAEDTRNLAVQETCKEKSKQVVSAKLIESLKGDIEKLKGAVDHYRERSKSAMARAAEYRKESAKLHARLTSEGIPLEPLSDEPALDEEEYPVEEGTMPTLPVSETQEVQE